jgi:hypothetical protein
MKSKLKAPGTERLKLRYDNLLSRFGFKCNLRCYTVARDLHVLEAGGRFAHEVFPVGVPGGRRRAGAPARGVSQGVFDTGARVVRGLCPPTGR